MIAMNTPAPTDISAKRYCDVPFPLYRYVPGLHPHPTAHPGGHSYRPKDAPHVPADWFPPERWRESIDYLYGCDLYNHAYWWEAHEAWESLWQRTDKREPQGRFLQGLIQASACHLKLHTGHGAGVARLLEGGMGHLRAAAPTAAAGVFMGLHVPAFVARYEEYYEAIRALPNEAWRHDPASYPYINLQLAGP